jgi:nucleotide-binding universal stress UspA family protein
MLKIERILCPVDFSEFSAKAYDYAYSLARRYGAKLFVEHVVQSLTSVYPYYAFPASVSQVYSDLNADAEKQLQEFVRKHRWDGVQPDCVVHNGPLAQSILSFAEKRAVDLIVIGTHGRHGLDRLTMGSVTEKILRKAPCPVLAVRRPAHDFVEPEKPQDNVHLRKILACTDFSDHANRALSYAFSLAMEYNAELTLLHVLEDIPASTDLRSTTADAVRQLERPIPGDARNWCTIWSTVRIGKPYQEIIQLALEAQTDLVILGVQGRNALDLALFGSTTHRVIQLGPCPVLAVHISKP